MQSYPKVGIVGAGQVGATCAFLLLLRDLADVVLLDVVEGLPQGKALDMMQARPILGFGAQVMGTNSYDDLAGSGIVVITAGLPRKPGMSRSDLLAANAEIVREVATRVVTAAPAAKIVVVTNPLDVMVYLAWKVTGLDPARIFGMGGVLDAARMSYYVSERLGVKPGDVEPVVMGSHGDKMVPLPAKSKVSGRTLTDVIDETTATELAVRTRGGGAEVVALLKNGSAFYAPAASIARMVQAILTDEKAVLPASTLLSGQYGQTDIFLGVPVTLGAGGVEGVVHVDLSREELAAFNEAAAEVSAGIAQLREMGALS
jgi:malate dehydrogenase